MFWVLHLFSAYSQDFTAELLISLEIGRLHVVPFGMMSGGFLVSFYWMACGGKPVQIQSQLVMPNKFAIKCTDNTRKSSRFSSASLSTMTYWNISLVLFNKYIYFLEYSHEKWPDCGRPLIDSFLIWKVLTFLLNNVRNFRTDLI